MDFLKNKKYYFTVEGETELWYLKWLKDLINKDERSIYIVSFEITIEKNPLKHAKTKSNLGKIIVYHLLDYESSEDCHVKQFKDAMDNMKKAKSLKNIDYKLCYSNFTFDLWIILHKSDCAKSYSNRSQYIKPINKAYNENFEDMDKYKKEKDFKRILDKLKIDNVIEAIGRAENIMKNNFENYTLREYKGYSYYDENPSLTIWNPIKEILKDCKIIH